MIMPARMTPVVRVGYIYTRYETVFNGVQMSARQPVMVPIRPNYRQLSKSQVPIQTEKTVKFRHSPLIATKIT